MFKIINTPYDVRVTKLEQPMRRTTNYGLRTFSYIGSRLWNLLVQEYPEVPHMDLGQFKTFLKHWTGPKCDVTEMHILQRAFSTRSLFMIYILAYIWLYILKPALYIFAPLFIVVY